MRRRPLILILAVVVCQPLVKGIPTGGDDDAQSGGDASDVSATPLQVEEGRYSGALTSAADPADHYRWEVKPDRLITVEVSSTTAVAMTVTDADGRVRDHRSRTDGLRSSYVGLPSGNWSIAFERPAGYDLSVPSDYTFAITSEPRDHLQALVLQGPIAEATIRIDRSASLFVEGMIQETFSTSPRASVDSLSIGDDRGCVIETWVESGNAAPAQEVIVHGALPVGGEVASPRATLIETSLRWFEADLRGLADATFHVSRAESGGGGLSLWLAWNGSAGSPLTTVDGGWAEFLTLADFEGGDALVVGPLVHAQGPQAGVSLGQAPHEVLFVNAWNPNLLPLSPTRFGIEPPWGDAWTVENGGSFVSPWAASGSYKITAENISGLGMATNRVVAAHFFAAPACLNWD